MGLASSKNDSFNKEIIKQLVKEILEYKDTVRVQKNVSDTLGHHSTEINKKNDLPAINTCNDNNVKSSQFKLVEDLVIKFKNENNLCGVERRDSNWQPGQLKPYVGKYKTIIFPDQLPDDIATFYVTHKVKNLLVASQISQYLNQDAE